MPTYVYACKSCGKQFEKFQSFKEDPLTICICGQEGQVRRVIQAAGVVFKGSGWYINDSRGSSSSTVVADTAKADKAEPSDKPAVAEKAAPSEKSDTSVSAPASSDA
jgi:putative FmdB family regulatory protein